MHQGEEERSGDRELGDMYMGMAERGEGIVRGIKQGK